MPSENSPKMAFFMGTYAVLTTVVYLVNKNPIFHEVMYGILVFALLGKNFLALLCWQKWFDSNSASGMDLHLNKVQKSTAGMRIFLAGFLM